MGFSAPVLNTHVHYCLRFSTIPADKGRQADAEYFRKDYPSSEKNDDMYFHYDQYFSIIAR
jgi:hypothetical protein